MRHSCRRLLTVLFWLFLCFGLLHPAFGQNVAGWTLDAPPDSVQLLSVEPDPMFDGLLRFTFKNVSGKTIIEFLVQDLHGRVNGFDAFTHGLEHVALGEPFARFPEQDFADQSARKVSVVAIVYSDGSRGGSPEWLERVENQMLGAALETRRIADILAPRPDGSIGFDRVAAQINIPVPEEDSDAVDGVHGIAPSGISVADIDRHLAQSVRGIRAGIVRARQDALAEIHQTKITDVSASANTAPAPQVALQSRAHTLSDVVLAALAKKYASLSESQARYIQALWALPQDSPAQQPASSASAHTTVVSPRAPSDGPQLAGIFVNGHWCTLDDRKGPCKDLPKRLAENEKHRREQFKPAKALLLHEKVPFDPDELLQLDWRSRLKAVLDTMPEMQRRIRAATLSGLALADVLYMPEHVFTQGLTVIIANHVVYEGRSPYARCGGDFFFFPGPSRVLGMPLDRALHRNGLDPKSFPDGLPPYSVIQDLDVPKFPLRMTINCDAVGAGNDAPEFGGPIMTTPH